MTDPKEALIERLRAQIEYLEAGERIRCQGGPDQSEQHWERIDATLDALASLSASVGVGVTVKPLTWSQDGCVAAAPVVGIYAMSETDFGRFELHTPFHSEEGTQDEVQALAQADYEARIKSALSLPSSGGEVGAE